MTEETLDHILGSRLRLYQKKKGYRFSLDSLLLAHFVSLKKHARVIELGCGNGIIVLILAGIFAQVEFIGLEIQDDLVTLAQKNVRFNNLDRNIKIVKADAGKIKNYFPASSFDCVIFNPPYRKLTSGRINPDSEKAIARHEIKGSLNIFVNAAKYLLKPSGKVFAIYPAKRLAELILRFRESNIEPKKMKLVFSDDVSPAEFVLIEGRKESHEELQAEQPLFIYRKDKRYTEELMLIFRKLSSLQGDDAG